MMRFSVRVVVAFLLAALSFDARVSGQQSPARSHQHTNELVNETSPYLLMHAHNPVQWHAWNEKTLAKAKSEDKPIFLSIGYSSCHWCHVMERESFLDEEIAKFLNQNFICVKVDREERPDVDQIYMQALFQIRRGGGGWPLSMFLTPEAKPFFGGTYWPARDGDRGAPNGFLSIVKNVEEHFKNNRDRIEQDADIVTEMTKTALAGQPPVTGLPIQKSWSGEATNQLAAVFDEQYGGFGFSKINPRQPKFPEPSNLLFLIDQIRSSSDPDSDLAKQAKKMLVKTCHRMLMGGIYDHLGGGFHRYSVDRFWRIPHFEKMLYDNALLATVYAEVYQLTGREEFRRVVEGTLAFVDRELKAESGAFYASLDAESEGEEGKFYRWELDEVKNTLTDQEFQLFAPIYGLDADPNFELKYYVPQLARLLSSHAQERSLDLEGLESKLQPIRKKILDVRNKRVRPLLDDKVLTAWNGLMIRGYADAGRILKNKRYIATAKKAADFLVANLTSGDGRLFRTKTKGRTHLKAYVVDYACLIDGLIALHRATDERKWLNAANRLQQSQNQWFWDSNGGGYFYTARDHEVLLARSKRVVDNALPSGNSVAAANLYYLGQQLDNDDYIDKAKQTVLSASATLTRAPHAAPRMLITARKFVSQ